MRSSWVPNFDLSPAKTLCKTCMTCAREISRITCRWHTWDESIKVQCRGKVSNGGLLSPNTIRHFAEAVKLPISAKNCEFCEVIRSSIIATTHLDKWRKSSDSSKRDAECRRTPE